MTTTLWIGAGLFASTVLITYIARKWQRRQKASKLADVLLSDVLKAKDSYRR
jgi:hypothetical protein